MQFKSVKGFTGFAQLGILLVFLGLGFILAGGAQLIIGMKIIPEGTPLQNMGDAILKAMMDPKNVAYSRLTQVLGTFLLLFVPAALFSMVVNGKNFFWLGFNRYINGYQLLLGFSLIFVANIMASPIETLTKHLLVHLPSLNASAKNLEDLYNDQVLALSNLKSWPEFLMAIIIMAFFPALFEEVFFRGALQNLLVRWWKKPLMAIIFTSLVFSLIHMSVYLFFSRALLGFVLGLMYHKSRNIWVNVIAHFLNNSIAVAQLFWMSFNNKKTDVSQLDPKYDWWVALIALVILFLLFRSLKKYSASNVLKIEARENVLLAEESPFHSIAGSENLL